MFISKGATPAPASGGGSFQHSDSLPLCSWRDPPQEGPGSCLPSACSTARAARPWWGSCSCASITRQHRGSEANPRNSGETTWSSHHLTRYLKWDWNGHVKVCRTQLPVHVDEPRLGPHLTSHRPHLGPGNTHTHTHTHIFPGFCSLSHHGLLLIPMNPGRSPKASSDPCSATSFSTPRSCLRCHLSLFYLLIFLGPHS